MTHLIIGTEDMGIVLLEPPDSGQTSQSTGELITVEDAKVRNSPWQLTVTSLPVTKQETVTRAVHGLQPVCILFNIKCKHILLVVLPMSRSLPQLGVVHVRSDDLLVITLPVLLPEKVKESIVNACAMRQEETTSRAELVEKEKFLVLSNLSVVSLCGLLQEFLVFLELLLVWETDTIYTLQRVIC